MTRPMLLSNAIKTRGKIGCHVVKGPVEGRAAGHDNIVETRNSPVSGSGCHGRFQAAPDAVSNHCRSKLFGNGEAEPYVVRCSRADRRPRLRFDDATRRSRPQAATNGEKVWTGLDGRDGGD
jgi:hypothetical protein